MKKNRYIETLRTTPMPYPDLCEQLFDGTMSTGIKSWGPSSNEPCIPTIDPPVVVEDDGLENLNDTTHSVLPSSSQPPPDKIKKQKAKQSADIVEEILLGVLDMIAIQMNKHKPSKPTFQDCLSKLNILGWPEYEPEYQVAVALFSDKNDNYIDCWMELKPYSCASWVRIIGSSKGFM